MARRLILPDMIKYIPFFLFLFYFVCFTSKQSIAQHADTTLTEFDEIGEFVGARAINSSPGGAHYIVDEAASLIYQFDDNWNFVRKHGGPGISEGQFDGPLDIDPTNGLILVVADAGNGRIQRFSREFLFLESLELGNYSDTNTRSFPDQPRYRQNDQSGGSGVGRPIAVATASNNEMYAIDAERQVVLKWDQDRNLIQIIGDYDAGNGSLVEPVAIALGDEGTLFILDRSHGSILVYDAFGGYLYEVGNGKLSDAVALDSFANMLMVALPDKIMLYHKRGLLEAVINLEIPESASDLLYSKGQLFVLGKKQLYRLKGTIDRYMKLGDS